jgi:hypothetical protein
MPTPPQSVINAVLAATTRTIRRVEIYESDSVTRWAPDTAVRLIAGSVNIDQTRDERRTLDLTLDNTDGVLNTYPGGFWYDKIIKCFRGVNVNEPMRAPNVLIIADPNRQSPLFRTMLATAGVGTVTVNTEITELADLNPYEVIVSLGGLDAPSKTDLLAQAYDAGKRIFTQGQSATEAELPFVTASSAVTPGADTPWSITPNADVSNSLVTNWHAESYADDTDGGTLPTTVRASALILSSVTVGATAGYTLLAESHPNGTAGRWVHMQPALYNTSNTDAFLTQAFTWLNPFVPLNDWEVQVGEFMIDKISEDNFPHQVKITGRDYTKKCLNSKFEVATEFDPGSTLESLIASISANAGISRKVLPTTGITVEKTFTYDQGTERWAALVEMATAYGYDIYFDGQGYLRMTPTQDPSTSPTVITLKTGTDGNLAAYTKTTDDSRLYNHVLVTGDTGDGTSLPPHAEAINTDPNSPTSVARIGDRLYQYSSTFIETTEQAQSVADSFLAVHSLEEYQLDLTSLVLFWLDVGNIIEFIDPSPAPGDPTRFLLSTMTIPLTLDTMSATALRITIEG